MALERKNQPNRIYISNINQIIMFGKNSQLILYNIFNGNI